MAGTAVEKELVTIRGIVTAAGWDDDGEITAIKLLSPDEKEYLIADDEVGSELMQFVQEEIEVDGILKAKKNGEMQISVKIYSITSESFEDGLKWEEDEWPVSDGTDHREEDDE